MNGYWNNLRPFEKRVLVGVGAATFIVFNMWFVIPHFSDWNKVQFRMDAARRKLQTYQTATNEMPRLQEEVKKMEGEGSSVPPEDQQVEFTRALQNESLRTKVTIVNYGTEMRDTNRPFFVEISKNIQTMSGESELVDFLYNLGAGNSLIRVRDLNVRPDPQHQQLDAGIKLVASYQKKTTPPRQTAAPPDTKAKASAPKAPAPATKTEKPPAKTPAAAPVTRIPTNKPTTTNPKKP